MTRTIGIVAAIAACCLHLGAPTAAGTKTRGNGGSDPDIGHNGPSSGMVPARTCSLLYSCHRCSALGGHSPRGQQGSRNRSGRLRRYALAGWTTLVSDEGTRLRPRSASISDGRIRGSKAHPGTDRLTPSCRRASVLREQLHVHGSLCAGGYNYTRSMECVLPVPRNSAVSLVVS